MCTALPNFRSRHSQELQLRSSGQTRDGRQHGSPTAHIGAAWRAPAPTGALARPPSAPLQASTDSSTRSGIAWSTAAPAGAFMQCGASGAPAPKQAAASSMKRASGRDASSSSRHARSSEKAS